MNTPNKLPADGTEQLIRETRRRRNATTLGRLETLLAEQTKWSRRATIARNRLAGVRAEIDSLATTLAAAQFDAELGQADKENR